MSDDASQSEVAFVNLSVSKCEWPKLNIISKLPSSKFLRDYLAYVKKMFRLQNLTVDVDDALWGVPTGDKWPVKGKDVKLPVNMRSCLSDEAVISIKIRHRMPKVLESDSALRDFLVAKAEIGTKISAITEFEAVTLDTNIKDRVSRLEEGFAKFYAKLAKVPASIKPVSTDKNDGKPAETSVADVYDENCKSISKKYILERFVEMLKSDPDIYLVLSHMLKTEDSSRLSLAILVDRAAEMAKNQAQYDDWMAAAKQSGKQPGPSITEDTQEKKTWLPKAEFKKKQARLKLEGKDVKLKTTEDNKVQYERIPADQWEKMSESEREAVKSKPRWQYDKLTKLFYHQQFIPRAKFNDIVKCEKCKRKHLESQCPVGVVKPPDN